MSRWCHLYGTLQLSGACYDHSGKGWGHLFDRKKQLRKPILEWSVSDNSVEATNFPLIKPIIDKELEAFPSGEYEKIHYELTEVKTARSSAGLDGKDLEYAKKNFGIDEYGWCNFIEECNLSFASDLRYCCGAELLQAFETFLDNIYKTKYRLTPRCGYVEWEDEFNDEYRMAIRFDFDESTFMILNRKTNAIEASKKHYVDYKWEGGKPFAVNKVETKGPWAKLLKKFEE